MTAYLDINLPQSETSLWRHSLRTWLRAQPGPATDRDRGPLAASPAGTWDRWPAKQVDDGADKRRGVGS